MLKDGRQKQVLSARRKQISADDILDDTENLLKYLCMSASLKAQLFETKSRQTDHQ